MTNIELVLNMLAEVTTTAISKTETPETVAQSTEIAIRGGRVAKDAKQSYEKATGQKVISPLNARDKGKLEIKNGVLELPK